MPPAHRRAFAEGVLGVGGAVVRITELAQPCFDHLHRLSGRFGVFEHALYDAPRRSLGYTTDDVARVLVVLGRESGFDLDTARLFNRCLDFVIAGRIEGGWHNRLSRTGRWLDRRGADDAHGRALWGLGISLRKGAHPDQERISSMLVRGTDLDTPSPRANAYALLGLTAAIPVLGDDVPSQLWRRLEVFRSRVPGPGPAPWPWPEARLAYANARIPEALIAVGTVLDDAAVTRDGLDLLDWLVETETLDGRFSFTPVGGRGPGDERPAFDQQPIEAWAMVDACARAYRATGDGTWSVRAIAAAEWFMGRNDIDAMVYDPSTGAGFDGIHPDRVNANRGAESTLAALGALQTWRRMMEGFGPD